MVEKRTPRRWSPMLWAMIALPLWAVLAMLPAALAAALYGTVEPSALWLIPGMAVATLLLLRVDRRVGPAGPAARFWPTVHWWSAAAALAGVGTMILASEVGNILMSLESRVGLPLEAVKPMEPWTLGGLTLVQILGLTAVLHGVVQRSLSLRLPGRWAVVGTVALGAFFGGTGLAIQMAALLVLPVWLFSRTGALLPSLMAMLPQAIVPLLAACGLELGIPGFDDTQSAWQPVWFDILGAVLLAAGAGPLLRAFDTEPPR